MSLRLRLSLEDLHAQQARECVGVFGAKGDAQVSLQAWRQEYRCDVCEGVAWVSIAFDNAVREGLVTVGHARQLRLGGGR